MIRLSRKRVPIPDVYAAPGNELANGRVYVVKLENGQPKSQLEDGKKAVLECKNGRLELRTRATVSGGMVDEGTYLDTADLAQLTDRSAPKIRRYRWRDTVRKARSGQGVILLLTTLLGVLAAAAGLYFAHW